MLSPNGPRHQAPSPDAEQKSAFNAKSCFSYYKPVETSSPWAMTRFNAAPNPKLLLPDRFPVTEVPGV